MSLRALTKEQKQQLIELGLSKISNQLNMTWDEIAEEFQGKAVVGKINVDECAELAEKFGIMSIPTMIIFKNGEIAEKMVGPRSKVQIAAAITQQM